LDHPKQEEDNEEVHPELDDLEIEDEPLDFKEEI